MEYLLIEFLGVFFLTLFRGLSNMAVVAADSEPIANALVNALALFIFCVLARSLSKGMFNPVFAIVENLWQHMSVETALGYITAHVLASLLSTSVLTIVVPFEVLSNPKLNLGVAKINSANDEFALLTMEMVGTFALFFGYLHYQARAKSEDPFAACFFYALVAGALQLATYHFNGGAYNLGTMVGGLLFSASADSKIVYVFFGNIIGAILAKLLFEQTMVERKAAKENKTLKKMLQK